jgi:hypothetical protein
MPLLPVIAGAVASGVMGDRPPLRVLEGVVSGVTWCWIMVLLTENLKDGGVVGEGEVSVMRVLRMVFWKRNTLVSSKIFET